MSATPPPTNQVQLNVTNVGVVPLSAAGLNSTNWPTLWGHKPPDNDPPAPATLSEFAEHMGCRLGPILTALNTAVAAADQDFQNGVSPVNPSGIVRAMADLNQFLNSTDSERTIHLKDGHHLTMPLVPRVGSGDPTSSPIGFTASYTPKIQFEGNLYIHVDGEPMPSSPTGFGSWQIVTGFEIIIWFTNPRPGPGPGGGPSSSSSYYASSGTGPRP